MIRNLPLLGLTPAAGAGCPRKDTCGLPSAGLDESTRAKVAAHPCYNQDAHQYYARLHLAVAPSCNVQCNYCNRKFDCVNESRPGVTSRVLSPEEALAKVAYVAAKVPQLSVVGIAGPGDPLANANRTFKTFELIKREFPDLRLCLSTNGLRLPENVARIIELGIDQAKDARRRTTAAGFPKEATCPSLLRSSADVRCWPETFPRGPLLQRGKRTGGKDL